MVRLKLQLQTKSMYKARGVEEEDRGGSGISMALVRKRTISTKRLQLVGEVSVNFRGEGAMWSAWHGCILGFLHRSHYLFFQVAPQL
jgi:hypothetical protein